LDVVDGRAAEPFQGILLTADADHSLPGAEMTTTSRPTDQLVADPKGRPPTTGRRVAAGAAVLAIIARVASILLWPPDSDASHAQMLATAAEHQTAWTAATATEVVAWVSAGYAVLAVTGLVHGRGRWPARIGGWWCGVSLLALGLVGGALNSVTGVIAQQPERSAMIRVQDQLHTPVLDAFVAIILLGELMLVIFGFGLVRARLVGWWFVVLCGLAVVGQVLTASSSSHLVVLAGFLPLGATWLALAWVLAYGDTRKSHLDTSDA
jgi:hypothetical protein